MLGVLCEHVVMFLDIRDLASARRVCAEWNRCCGRDQLWERLARRERGGAFWDLARRRPAVSSRPLRSWEREVRRLCIFDALCRRKLGHAFSNQTMYLLWHTMDAVHTGAK